VEAVWIGLAGGLGTLLRYGTGLAAARWFGSSLPFGTLLVNVLGSFALGLVAEALHKATWAGTDARLVLGVGLLGGFTTYSSFNLETLRMAQRGELGLAAGYAAATFAACLVAGLAGLMLGRTLAS
jgi:CrcB protein